MSSQLDRRQFLEASAAGLMAVAAPTRPGAESANRPTTEQTLFAAPPLDVVRIGFVGVGHQGSSHVENFLKIDGVEIRAICDLVPAKVAAMREELKLIERRIATRAESDPASRPAEQLNAALRFCSEPIRTAMKPFQDSALNAVTDILTPLYMGNRETARYEAGATHLVRKVSSFLSSDFGYGKTPESEALLALDYINRLLQGKSP